MSSTANTSTAPALRGGALSEDRARAHLVLADGTVFAGTAIGASGSSIGEAVFTTGMTGY